jgi:hypothetical protein
VLGVSSYVRQSSKDDIVTLADNSQPKTNSKTRQTINNIFNSREYIPMDKRGSMTKTTEGISRPSKSPVLSKKMNA